MMRSTTNFTTAMHRLADTLSWRVSSNGRTWVITTFPHGSKLQETWKVTDTLQSEPPALPPETFVGLTFKAISLLCLMTRVTMSPERFGGLGWTAEQVRDAINLDMSQDRDGSLVLPGDTTGTDEATMYRLFKGVD